MSIDGLIYYYILMAFGEIKSRFQKFEGIVDALSSLKTVFYMLQETKPFFMTQVHILANSECFDIKKITFFNLKIYLL